MGVNKPRTRLISFRLSDEEYERLHDALAAEGARSLSDFARITICERVLGSRQAQSAEPRLKELASAVEELRNDLATLSQRLDSVCIRLSRDTQTEASC